MGRSQFSLLFCNVVLVTIFVAPAHAEVDIEAAKVLARTNDCLKCHAAEKDKLGPSIAKIAAKYKGVADAQAKAIEHMTSGPTVKLSDGVEVQHKIIGTKDPLELANIANWFLSH